jgi:hypothetical protein
VIARRDKGENRPRFTVATLAFAPGHWEAFVASQENMWGGGPTALFLVKRCPSAAHRRRVCPLALSLCPKAVGAGHQQGRNLWGMIPRPRSRCKASPDAAVLPGQPGGHPSPTKNSTDIISETAKGVDDRNFRESCKPLKSWQRIFDAGKNSWDAGGFYPHPGGVDVLRSPRRGVAFCTASCFRMVQAWILGSSPRMTKGWRLATNRQRRRFAIDLPALSAAGGGDPKKTIVRSFHLRVQSGFAV